jgi:hypothetical protein
VRACRSVRGRWCSEGDQTNKGSRPSLRRATICARALHIAVYLSSLQFTRRWKNVSLFFSILFCIQSMLVDDSTASEHVSAFPPSVWPLLSSLSCVAFRFFVLLFCVIARLVRTAARMAPLFFFFWSVLAPCHLLSSPSSLLFSPFACECAFCSFFSFVSLVLLRR